MIDFITTLQSKNESLFYFGLVNFGLGLLFFVLTKITTVKVNNINAFIKPIKFAISIGIYSWTMILFCSYLSNFNVKPFNYTIISLLGFEIIYIAIQASRGQLSHFNISSPLFSVLYTLMGLAASVVTVYTAYVAVLFFKDGNINLPIYYLWSIRIGLIIFVIFSFEGFVMGAKLSHTIGGVDGSEGIAFLNWSKTFGDPRVAHFIGMHSLQVIPLLSFYVLKNKWLVLVLGILYFVLAAYTLQQALNGKPFFKKKSIKY